MHLFGPAPDACVGHGLHAAAELTPHAPLAAITQTEGDAWQAECSARDGVNPDTDPAYAAQAIRVQIPDLDAEGSTNPVEERYKAASSRGHP